MVNSVRYSDNSCLHLFKNLSQVVTFCGFQGKKKAPAFSGSGFQLILFHSRGNLWFFSSSISAVKGLKGLQLGLQTRALLWCKLNKRQEPCGDKSHGNKLIYTRRFPGAYVFTLLWRTFQMSHLIPLSYRQMRSHSALNSTFNSSALLLLHSCLLSHRVSDFRILASAV